MKKGIYILTSLLLLFFASCKKDDENDTPEDDPRVKFEGNWTCKETCKKDGSTVTFSVTISKSTSSSSDILIANFNQLGSAEKISAVVAGYNLTIPQQTTSTGYQISGSGTMDSKKTSISMSYSVNDGAQTDDYTAALTK
ncbi:MAG: hypothetical protein PHD97_01800 [Bacteroidales bacterium]|jgi:hypothetical protein|nr:hypothetical protein [Bacteroidales bacterium]